MQHELAGAGWEWTEDVSSITLLHRNVRFVNPLSRPAWESEEDKWKDSFTVDYRITICLDTKLSQAEYDGVSKLRAEFIAERTKGAHRRTKQNYSAFKEAENTLHLPDYYWENNSVYVYCSDF